MVASIRIAEEQVHQHDADARADSAEEVILEETSRSPGLLDGRAEHPERQHVEQDVEKPVWIVQEQVRNSCHTAPRITYAGSVEAGKRPGSTIHRKEINQVDRDIRNDQPLYAARKRPVKEGNCVLRYRVS